MGPLSRLPSWKRVGSLLVHQTFLAHSSPSPPTFLPPCRSFSEAVARFQNKTSVARNESWDDISDLESQSSTFSEAVACSQKRVSGVGKQSWDDISDPETQLSSTRKKRQPELAVKDFFVRARAIAQIMNLLKEGVSEDELLKALRALPVPFDNLLVTQVLRVDLPCDVSLKFFKWLTNQEGYDHNEYTYGVMLNNLGRAERLDQMEQLFDEMKGRGCAVSRATMSNIALWYYKAKDMRGLASHWNALRRAGTKPSAAIYSAYMDFLIRADRLAKVAVLYEEMLRNGCVPTSRTYTVFIEHLVEAGNVDAAAKILKCMQKMRITPSRVTYKYVINGFARSGDIEMIMQTLREMREHFIRPMKHLMPAVTALQAAGKQEEASTLLEEIHPKCSGTLDEEDGDDADCAMTVWRSVSCSEYVFDVSAFAEALYNWNSAIEKVLGQANVQWDSPLVLGTLRRLKSLDSMWPFFHWLRKQVGFQHDSYSCALLVQKILKSRCTLEEKDTLLRDLFNGLREDGMTFTVPVFNSVIRYYIVAGEAEKAFGIFNLMKAFGLEPNDISYCLVIQGFSKNSQGKKAVELLKEMKEQGYSLDSTTCAQLITCLGLAKKPKRAYALFCKKLESNEKPGPLEYKAILTVFSNVGDNGMALKLYEDMRKAGIKPTQDMHEVVVRILKSTGRESDVQVLAQERRLLNFFDGNKKVLQESLMEVLFTFMEGMKVMKSQKAKPVDCT